MAPLHDPLLGDPETAAHFTAEAEIAAMLQVWQALARVQGELSLIPAGVVPGIIAALQAARVDPADLAPMTATNGVPVPGLLQLLRRSSGDLDHLHWGATSQDIIDTGLMLRLSAALDLWDGRLARLITGLGRLAGTHADLPMAARTYGQAAVPTTFGACVAGWGRPLIRHRAALAAVRTDLLQASLGGAAGTLSAMGAQGPAVRAGLATALGLGDPGGPWHSDRSGVAGLSGWMAGLAASLGKMAEDVILMTQTGIAELRLTGAGGSSTMPQKQNPVAPSAIVALSRQVIGLSAILTGAGLHRQARDGAAWFTEWLTLPPMGLALGAALRHAVALTAAINPDPAAMAQGLAADHGLIAAESLTFALAVHMSRPDAEAAIKALITEALAQDCNLPDLFAARWPDIPLALPDTGLAAAEARAFAALAQYGSPV
jgi:3-carboxy-cis,cis-muconate cycloisomerase